MQFQKQILPIKLGISLKEMRESNYWIRLVIGIVDQNEVWKSQRIRRAYENPWQYLF